MIHDMEHLYHYYDKSQPPFRTITALSYEEAAALFRKKQEEDPKSVNPNIEWFLTRRYEMEKTVWDKFIAIGGKPIRTAPIYCTLGANDNMKTWFGDAAYISMPVRDFDLDTISFTYGDMFTVFNPALNTGEEWWGQVYRYEGILKLIEKYGYPEDPAYDMKNWIFPKDKPINQYLKYIEAHVWNDTVLDKYRIR